MLLFRCKVIKVMHYFFLSRLFVSTVFCGFFSSVLIYNRKDKINIYIVIINIVAVTYVGRNSTVSTGHQKNQRLSKAPPPHPAPKARIFFRSQNKGNSWEDF